MANTITFEMTETQAQKFEKILDDTLEILNRMEKETPERNARFDKHHEEFQRTMADTEKMMERLSQRMAKWELPLEK